MRTSILLFFAVCNCNIVSAQTGCDSEKIKTAPGTWTTYVDQNTGGLTAAELAAERKLLTAIRQIFQDQYKPIGVTAQHSFDFNANPSEIDTRNPNRYGHPFDYMMLNFSNYCKDGKVLKDGHSHATLLVLVNWGQDIGNSYETIAIIDQQGRVNSKGFFGFNALQGDLIKNGSLPDLKKGWFLYGGPDQAGFDSDYSWWITREGSEQPFHYVTRREFLQKQIAIQHASIADIKKQRDNKEFQDALKSAGRLDEFIKSLNGQISILEKTIADYQNDLQKDEAWLNELSVVTQDVSSEYVRLVFVTLNDRDVFVPLKPNPAYYNRKLPKSAPQFMTISLRGASADICVQSMKKVIDDNMDKFVSMVANAGK